MAAHLTNTSYSLLSSLQLPALPFLRTLPLYMLFIPGSLLIVAHEMGQFILAWVGQIILASKQKNQHGKIWVQLEQRLDKSRQICRTSNEALR